MPPHRLKALCGPISHPQKVPSNSWVLKVTAGIAKSTTTPAHMTTSAVRSHRPNQAITHAYTGRLTKRFHSPHRKPPGKAAQPEQQTSCCPALCNVSGKHALLPPQPHHPATPQSQTGRRAPAGFSSLTGKP